MAFSQRRRFLRYFGGAAIFSGSAGAQSPNADSIVRGSDAVPGYARAQTYRSLKQSSYDRSGGNRDSWRIGPGETKEVFSAQGPGIITHIWFTTSAQSPMHLKEL